MPCPLGSLAFPLEETEAWAPALPGLRQPKWIFLGPGQPLKHQESVGLPSVSSLSESLAEEHEGPSVFLGGGRERSSYFIPHVPTVYFIAMLCTCSQRRVNKEQRVCSPLSSTRASVLTHCIPTNSVPREEFRMKNRIRHPAL